MSVRPLNPYVLWAVIASLGTGMPAEAQHSPPGAEKTLLQVELLTPRIGGRILAPQEWGQLFEKLGQTVLIRSPVEGDKPQVTEEIRGTLRFVRIVGILDRDGRLLMGDRIFTLQDGDKINGWLNELKVYGAQGSPAGQPLWGLSPQQFEALFARLAQPVTDYHPTGRLTADLAQIPIDSALPVRVHQSLGPLILEESALHGTVDLTGLTAGTALAALLALGDLGFRPLRTPDGSVELVIERLSDISDPWPIGWNTPQDRPPGEVAPHLFRVGPAITLEPQSIESALQQSAQAIPVSIVIDYHRCSAAGIDVRRVQTQYPRKQTAWAVVLRTVLQKNQLNYTLRHDEQGQVFVYVHPFEKTALPRR